VFLAFASRLMHATCQPFSFLRSALSCWNWKCALLSAGVRSIVYLAAMARTHSHGMLAVVMVEIMYVTMTAGIYAGLQQKALEFAPGCSEIRPLPSLFQAWPNSSTGSPIGLPEQPLQPSRS